MIPHNFGRQVADIYWRIAELERRARNRKRTGVVAEVGTGENAGKYKVQLSAQGDKPFISGWLKSRVLGGGSVKIDVMRSVGEQVDVVSESGDLADAEIDLSTYSNDNARENGENVPFHLKIGDTILSISGNTATLTAADIALDGDVTIKGAVTIEGASLTHNGKNVGSDHEHENVTSGTDNTGPPA